ncbi:MAG: hypothetical protein OFPII_35580 [Osedax symbiont Rs1]|nr:MAG: hypothetical protein OFPII_35580 [Osedax symbiont Rs1]
MSKVLTRAIKQSFAERDICSMKLIVTTIFFKQFCTPFAAHDLHLIKTSGISNL